MEILKTSVPQSAIEDDLQNFLAPAADHLQKVDEDLGQDFPLRPVFLGHVGGRLVLSGRYGAQHVLLDPQVPDQIAGFLMLDDEPPEDDERQKQDR
jgi:hypothetical protein